ncbi:MAG: 3-phosphoshikimate 1-carboxyvinyltransferase [Crenarchaeota archaeon 13_1_40CM_3_52_10]|nr:MAG: 3-phosphoshikimate 1-carboxyvinyltransferase [Crenarchaeota archaeon 13_1_40CM_3_52_10]
MKVRIKGPQALHGKVKAPRSKAYTHRALIASLLSEGESVIDGALHCDDTQRTIEGIQRLGAKVAVKKTRTISYGIRRPTTTNRPIDCGESGATLRFLTAISSTSLKTVRLTCSPRLANRPLDPLVKAINTLGADARAISDKHGFEVLVRGPLRGGEVTIRGDISSQFISGLLFAAPLAIRDVTINVEGELESRPYLNMSIDVLRRHGISIDESDDAFRVPAPQKFVPAFHQVPGDFSSAAFLIATTGIAGEEITISGLGSYELEPDSAILKIAPDIGLEIQQNGDSLTIGKRELDGFDFDASNNPDLVPPLEILGCFADGSTEIRGVKRLVYKESNRLQTLPTELVKMGAKIHVEDDMIKIEGNRELVASTFDSHSDHRVAMACAAASLGAKGESTIQNSDAVSKSYPEFFQDLSKLGAELSVE